MTSHAEHLYKGCHVVSCTIVMIIEHTALLTMSV